jgi:uncharacterized Zn-binding protein involved in type VI secretion
MRRYHIRAGATTTAGGVVRASSSFMKVNGAPLAREGDEVDCPACGTVGIIQVVPPRIPDTFNGKQYALSDDLCICKCNPPPKLVTDQTFKFQTMALASAESDEEAAARAARAKPAAAPALSATYDERTRLIATPIEGVPYYIETMDGRTFSGRTGADGLLPRIDTHGENEYTVYWGDEALAKIKEGQANG